MRATTEDLTQAPLEELFRTMQSANPAQVENAWGECYKRYNRKVWSCVFYVIRTIPWLKEPGEVAVDVTSEVFARLPQTLGAYQEVGKAESWLMQVAVRTAIRQKESITGSWSKGKSKRIGVELNDTTAQEIAASFEGNDRDDRMELERRMEEWQSDPEKKRWTELVNLFLEGYGHDEIAERLGITPGTSRTLLWKIRRELGRESKKQESA